MKLFNIISISCFIIALAINSSGSEKVTEERNVAKAYDLYYSGGKGSTFGLRFGKRETIPREEEVIANLFKQAYLKKDHNKKNMTLLDFGCGHGRFLEFYEELAQKYSDIDLEIVGYDVSIVGLNEFANRLQNSGFKKLNYNKIGRNASIVDEWQKKNLKVILFHSKGLEGTKEITVLLEKPVDVLVTMYATLCHISGRVNRQATIKNLSEQLDTNGLMLINVSTPRSIFREYDTYQLLRSQLAILDKHSLKSVSCNIRASLKNALENGDFYYCKDNSDSASFIFGHAYSQTEIEEDILSANLKIKDTGVISIKEPYQLTKTKFGKYIDYLQAKFLSLNLPFYPFNKLDQVSNSIFAIVSK